MTPEQHIRHIALHRNIVNNDADYGEITADNIDEIFEENEDQVDMYEIREGEVETGIRSGYSRHYESKSVAAKSPTSVWIGWTYWYGGGKHGEPEAIDWMSEAYFISCVEEEKLVVVQTFSKI